MAKASKYYNLRQIYNNESKFRRYARLTCGEKASIWSLIQNELVLTISNLLPGIFGWVFRRYMYATFFDGFSKNAFIGKNVTIRCPLHVTLSCGVVLDDFAQVIATSRHQQAIIIGANSFVRSFAMLNAGPPNGFIHIGTNSSIGQGALLYGNGGLVIGNNVMIAGQSAIVASSHLHDISTVPMVEQGYSAKGIAIHDNVWIGAGAKILDGVTIEEGAIVGANALVNHSVIANDVVGGIPARSLSRKKMK